MGAYLRCPTCGEEDSFEVSVGCDNKECLSNTVWETNKQLQAENEFLKKRVSELEKDCDKFVNIGFVCEGEARDFKAENEALKAKVAVLVETVRKMNRFFNCPTSCGIDSVDDKREAAFEQASELCDSALKDLSQTDQAYTEQVKKEAYQEASDYFKNHFDTVVMPELKTNEQKNLERVQSAVDTKITDVSEQVRREAVDAERGRIKKRLPDAEFMDDVTGMEAVYTCELEHILEDRMEVAIVFGKPNEIDPQQSKEQEEKA